MKKDKILITINNLDDINKLNELGITKYVFPLKDFCVGMMMQQFAVMTMVKHG